VVESCLTIICYTSDKTAANYESGLLIPEVPTHFSNLNHEESILIEHCRQQISALEIPTAATV
jgi:hypothetical protein